MHYGNNIVAHNPLANDLDHIFLHTEEYWEELRNQRIFITGGTGFFGCWLLESFLWAHENLGLNASVLVLTRNIENFKKKAPRIAGHPAVQLYLGDVRNFTFPAGTYSHVIHISNEAADYINEKNHSLMTEAIVQAAKHTLEFSRYCGARKFLYSSSGLFMELNLQKWKIFPKNIKAAMVVMILAPHMEKESMAQRNFAWSMRPNME